MNLESVLGEISTVIRPVKLMLGTAVLAFSLQCSPAPPEGRTVREGNRAEHSGWTDDEGKVSFSDVHEGTPLEIIVVEVSPSRAIYPLTHAGVTVRDGLNSHLTTVYKEGYFPVTIGGKPTSSLTVPLVSASSAPPITISSYYGGQQDPILEQTAWLQETTAATGCYTYEQIQTKNKVYTTILNFLGVSYIVNSLQEGVSFFEEFLDVHPDDFVYYPHLVAPKAGDNLYAAFILPVPVAGTCGSSSCIPEYDIGCFDGSARWQDSCGGWGEMISYCTTEERCADGLGCVPDDDICASHSFAECLDLSRFQWFDSCGNPQDTDVCGSEEYCIDGACYECDAGCDTTSCMLSDDFEGDSLDTRCRWMDSSTTTVSGGIATIQDTELSASLELVRGCHDFSLEVRARVSTSEQEFGVLLGPSYLRYHGSDHPNTLIFGCSTSGGTSTNYQEGVSITSWNILGLQRQGEDLHLSVNGTLQQTVPCYGSTTSQLSFIPSPSSSTITLELDYVTLNCDD